MSSDAAILDGIGDYKYGFSDPDTFVFEHRAMFLCRDASNVNGERSLSAKLEQIEQGADDVNGLCRTINA